MATYENWYDLVITGAGVTGSGQALVQNYGNCNRILHVDRQRAPGLVNSNPANNSHTLHHGLEETNYPLKKAKMVHWGAEMIDAYLERFPHQSADLKLNKMVIAVGEQEVAKLTARYHEFKADFPNARLLTAEEIGEVEPNVMIGRKKDQPIVALSGGRGRAVNYQKLAESFVANSGQGTAQVERMFHTSVDAIRRVDGGFAVTLGRDTVFAKAVIHAAGAPSLAMAHSMGYGLDYGMLPVEGDFWVTHCLLNWKVYTMQNEAIPLAAPHGDPAVYNKLITRWGPTARPSLLLERHDYGTLQEFIRTGMLTPLGIWAGICVASQREIGTFLAKNVIYNLPWIGRRAFAKTLRKIVPALQASDLRLDKGAGGIRGQLVHLPTRKLAKGTDRIVAPDGGIIFEMAPSPGASFSLGAAVEDARTLAREDFLGKHGYHFDEAAFRRDLGLEPNLTPTGRVTVEVRN